MPIEQQDLRPIAAAELVLLGDKLPFILLHMQRQSRINVEGHYNEEKQIWEEPAFCKKRPATSKNPHTYRDSDTGWKTFGY